ncbi:heterocycloanthracin/sonorensin family bacteriocin, partial [Paenibacillus sp. P22]|uniref:heterocycloanthracin/sonorensin family bacteriocin n=1 Tax=Paenibacillus sp. P22 TaxID=483908 RepID=UPI0009F842A5
MNEFKNDLQNLNMDAFKASGITPNAGQGQVDPNNARLCIGVCIGFCIGFCGGCGGCGGCGAATSST